MKKLLLFRKTLCIAVSFCMCMTTYSAIVSDNDGSAFVTKAEFDSLKESFSKQINEYSQSIDGKIDGAIASYLSGIKLSSIETLPILVPGAATDGVYAFNQKNPLDYKICYPVMSGQIFRSDINTINSKDGKPAAQPAGTRVGAYKFTFIAPTDISKNKGNKTVIKNLYQNATAGKSVASWDGYHTECIDNIILRAISNQVMWATGFVGRITNTYSFAAGRSSQITDTNIINQQVLSQMRFSVNSGTVHSDGSFDLYPTIYAIRHDWGKTNYPYICVTSNYDYDMFSNYDRDYNFSYKGSYMTKFPVTWDGSGKVTEYAQNATVERPTTAATDVPEYKPIGCNVHKAWNNCIAYTTAEGWYSDANGCAINLTNHFTQTSSHHITFGKYGYINKAATWHVYVPMVGFETTYLTNWNQIYIDDYDSIVKEDSVKTLTTNTIISDASNKHLSVCAGFPIAKIKKNTKLTNFIIKFDDGNSNDKYDVWFKFSPFTSGNPDNEDCFEDFEGLTKDDTKNHAFKVSGNATVISMKDYRTKEEGDGILFMKWAKINSSDRSKDGGGILYPSKDYQLVIDNS